jgi:hypothetical protein
MPCIVKKTFEEAAAAGALLIAQVKNNQPTLRQCAERVYQTSTPVDQTTFSEVAYLVCEFLLPAALCAQADRKPLPLRPRWQLPRGRQSYSLQSRYLRSPAILCEQHSPFQRRRERVRHSLSHHPRWPRRFGLVTFMERALNSRELHELVHSASRACSDPCRAESTWRGEGWKHGGG